MVFAAEVLRGVSGHIYVQHFATYPFEPYPGYGGDLNVFGEANLWQDQDQLGRQHISYSLSGVDSDCSQAFNASNVPDACILAVHIGKSCRSQSVVGVHYWNYSTLVQDPWSTVRYFAVNGNAKAKRQHGSIAVIKTGLPLEELLGHVLTVADANGNPVACTTLTHACKTIWNICLHNWAFIIAGTCSALAVILSLVLINVHLRKNEHPQLRICTVRILLIVPIYSLQAFSALFFQSSQRLNELFSIAREFYEAIVILTFLQFVLVCCGGPRAIVRRFTWHGSPNAGSIVSSIVESVADEDRGVGAHQRVVDASVQSPRLADGVRSRRSSGVPRVLKHLPLVRLVLPAWTSARQMLRWCILGTLSYVVFGLLLGIVSLVLYGAMYHKVLSSDFFQNFIKVGIVLLSCTQGIAIFSLAELADNLLEELRPIRPLPKFLSVKLVVFFTLWQKYALMALDYIRFFKPFVDPLNDWSTEGQLSSGVQNFLICIEMFAASVVHPGIFRWDDYQVVERRQQEEEILQAETAASEAPATAGLGSFVTRRLAVVDVRDIFQTIRAGAFADVEGSTATLV